MSPNGGVGGGGREREWEWKIEGWHQHCTLVLIDREIMWFLFLTQEELCSPPLCTGVWSRALSGCVLPWWWPGACGCIGCLWLAWLWQVKEAGRVVSPLAQVVHPYFTCCQGEQPLCFMHKKGIGESGLMGSSYKRTAVCPQPMGRRMGHADCSCGRDCIWCSGT